MRILVLLIVAAWLNVTHVSSQDESLPYIYYHSEALNAIVIERADGSDSRTIGRGLMPDNHDYVDGPGWSASGQWFAWVSGQLLPEYGARVKKLWVMRADGEERLTFLDTIENVGYVSWSPSGDYLLVIEQYRNETAPVHLIDVAQKRIIASFDDLLFDFSSNPQFWSADGQSIQVGYENVRVVYVDGHIEDNVAVEDRPALAPREPLKVRPPLEDHPPLSGLSPTGEHEIIVEDYAIYRNIRNLSTNETITLRPYSGSSLFGEPYSVCVFDWHPDGNWLIVTFNMTYAGGGCAFNGASIIKADGTIQRELGPCFAYDNCAGWLPERVLPYLVPGLAQSVVPDPSLTLIHDGWIRAVAWHPDNTQLAVYTTDNKSKQEMLYLWDISSETQINKKSLEIGLCDYSRIEHCNIIFSPNEQMVGITGLLGTLILDLDSLETVFETEDYLLGFDDDNEPIFIENRLGVDYNPMTREIARFDWDRDTIEIFSTASDEINTRTALVTDKFLWFSSDLAFVPSTDLIAIAGDGLNGGEDIYLWDTSSNTIASLPIYRGSEYVMNIVAYDPDVLIGYGLETTLYFWDIATQKVSGRLNRYATTVALSPDQSRLAIGSGYVVELWNYPNIIQQLTGNE